LPWFFACARPSAAGGYHGNPSGFPCDGMTVVFRADASTRMGTGHVTRSVTLARTLQARGARTYFVCRAHQGHLIDVIRGKGLEVRALPAPMRPPGEAEDYLAWLGVSEVVDADETIGALAGEKPEWLVADHYALGASWEQRLRPHAGKILAIDDLAGRQHDCDVLLDQNYSAQEEDRHRGVVPDGCRVLNGPRYAILAPEYEHYRHTRPARDGLVRRVLVYFGGTDIHDLTGLALEAMSTPEFLHLDADVVIGTNNAHRASLAAQAASRPRTHVHEALAHLAELMVRADAAIGAGGVTTWERMCLGLPSVVVSLADNQRPACEALSAAGLIQYAGHVGSAGRPEIGRALGQLMRNRDRLASLSTRGQALVDGQGASRVADVMVPDARDGLMRMRQALHRAGVCPAGFDTFRFAWIDACDARRVLALRNMPHVAGMMRSPGAITEQDHRAFLDRYAHLDRYDFVLIDESRDRYVGAFYITHLTSSPQLGKYIGDPGYLGKGIAHQAMLRLLDYCRDQAGLKRLTAITRRDNASNIALNAKLGFTCLDAPGDEYVAMTREL
jgi:UDP-2,4-diacetamido-2,4,6-trideoxy-beta-L-altropyranose hydrolase